jgi:hypothetical protein
MKRMAMCLWLLFIATSTSPFAHVARAQEANPCTPDSRKVTYYDKDRMGFEITFPEDIAPPFPIVFGQDLQEKTGVTIKIEIRSTPGSISYETFDGYVDECRAYPTWEAGLEPCPPNYSGGLYYYKSSVPKCTPHEEIDVYRTILGSTLKVWLMPSSDTTAWLGWDTTDTKGRNPLRYLFPERWSLGSWTPGGYTTVGSDYMFTEEQIEQFIAENPDFEFLKSDPREDRLPSYALPRVEDPTMGGQAAAARVLGLFGGFENWYTHTMNSQPGECLVNRTGTSGVCGTETNISTSDPSMEFFNADLSAEGIIYLRLGMYNIPVDLPGEWSVGVSVSVNPATYDQGRRTENVPPNDEQLKRYPGNFYDPDDHKFIVYILISTPCNSMEIGGCDT